MQPLRHTPLIPLTPDQMLKHQVILTVNLPLLVMVCLFEYHVHIWEAMYL